MLHLMWCGKEDDQESSRLYMDWTAETGGGGGEKRGELCMLGGERGIRGNVKGKTRSREENRGLQRRVKEHWGVCVCIGNTEEDVRNGKRFCRVNRKCDGK